MNFVLRYRGPLASNGGRDDKHRIRLALHPQLREMCKTSKPFELALTSGLPEVVMDGRKAKVRANCFFFWVRVGECRVMPLINRPRRCECSVDVAILRREEPGAIIGSGGDLDNRLKTLFDALRIPQQPSELPDNCGTDDLFCLLEDDSLITRVSVSADRLLEPPANGHEDTNVDLWIRVGVQSRLPMSGGLGV